MFNSIRSKLVVFVVALLVVVAGATLGAVLYFFTDYADSSAKEQARSGVEGLHNLLEESKNDMKAKAVMLAVNPDVGRAVEARDTAQVLAIMGKILKEAPIDSVSISDNQGVVIARTHEPSKKGDSIAKQRNVSEALKGNVTSAIEPGPVIKISARAGAPVRNAQGQIVGVITTSVSLSKNETVDYAKKIVQSGCHPVFRGCAGVHHNHDRWKKAGRNQAGSDNCGYRAEAGKTI